jgi:hypothetical protein
MGAAALLAATTFVPATASAAGSENGSGFNQPGNILIADQFNNRVVEVDRQLHELNAPYDAKVIGDFTGLTPPPPEG